MSMDEPVGGGTGTLHNITHSPFSQDFEDVKAGRQTKPQLRAEQEFDLGEMVGRCTEWQQVKALVQETPTS